MPMAVCHLYGQHTFYSMPHVASLQVMASVWNDWIWLDELCTQRVLGGESSSPWYVSAASPGMPYLQGV
jgi:hypothetical protein